MNDTEQRAYDAANKRIRELSDELCLLSDELHFYRNLASRWHDIAYQLMSIDRLREQHESMIKEGNNTDE